jgi:hypothetical protein
MADALTCIKDHGEALNEFNKRLKAECDKFEPTRVQLTIIDGEPCVILLAETVEADEDDVDDAKEHGATIEDEKTKQQRPIVLGDEIPAGDIVCVKLAKVAAFETPKMAATRKGKPTEGMSIAQISEERLDNIYTQAKGLITDHILASGVPVDPAYPGQIVHYFGVVYVPIEEVDDAQDAAAGEAALRS